MRDKRSDNGWCVEPTLWIAHVNGVYCLCWDRPDNREDLAAWNECERAMRSIERAMRLVSGDGSAVDVLSAAHMRVLASQHAIERLLSPGAREVSADSEWVRWRGKRIDLEQAGLTRSTHLDRVIAKFEARQAKRLRNRHNIPNGHVPANKSVS